MSSRHSTPHHTTQPARRGSSENRALMEIHIRKSERPQDRHIPRDRPEKTRQQEFPANHLPPTPPYSREPENGHYSRHTPRSETGSSSLSSSSIPRSPSQNAERRNHNSRSPSVASSSDASDRSVDTGNTSHSEYIPDGDSDTSAESADDLVDISETESEVSVISAGTRREMADVILQAAAQRPAEAEGDAAELQAQAALEAELEVAAKLEAARVQAETELEAAARQKECRAAYERLCRIREKIARYESKARTNNTDFSSLAGRRHGLLQEEEILTLVRRRHKICLTVVRQQYEEARILSQYDFTPPGDEGLEHLSNGN